MFLYVAFIPISPLFHLNLGSMKALVFECGAFILLLPFVISLPSIFVLFNLEWYELWLVPNEIVNLSPVFGETNSVPYGFKGKLEPAFKKRMFLACEGSFCMAADVMGVNSYRFLIGLSKIV